MSTQENSELRVVVTPGPRPGLVNVEAMRGDRIVHAATFPHNDAGKRHTFAQRAGVDETQVAAEIRRFRDALQAATNPPQLMATPALQPVFFFVSLRGMNEPVAAARTLSGTEPIVAIANAIAIEDYPAPEPVIEWEGKDQLAVVDVDFHHAPLDGRPSPQRLESLALRIRPRAALHWCSHGRGLHLVYQAQGGLTAAELAACAAVSILAAEPLASVEILSRTRHPLYPRPDHPAAGAVHRNDQTEEIGELGRWLGREVNEAAIEQWLAERGLERNRRYDHSRCPINPAAASHGEPVLVGETGITCFKCEADGVAHGRNAPGRFPWTALVSGGVPTRVFDAAWHFTHWEHAKHIFAEELALTGELAKACYTAMMKVLNGPHDPRVGEAMRRGRGLVRMDGFWATPDMSRSHTRDGLSDRLAVLPAVLYVVTDDKGNQKLVVNRERLGIFRGVDDLSMYGYPPIQPIRGMRIASHFGTLQDREAVRAVVLPHRLKGPGKKQFRPTYRPPLERMPQCEAEQIIAESFPGINFNYIRLLIAGRGCAEAGVGQEPKVAVSGPSGSGKNMTISVAAAFIGDGCCEAVWNPSVEEFHRSLFTAMLQAGLVSSSEIVKLARKRGVDARSALNGLLNFGPGTMVRLLYTGPVRMGYPSLVVVTDTAFPPEVVQDEQIGRRFTHVQLHRKVDWQRSVRSGIANWRTFSRDHAEAANSIVSDVIDRFFAGPTPLCFEDIGRQLGFPLLLENDVGLDRFAELRALFAACCDPRAVQAPTSSWSGRGWKHIRREANDALSAAWRAVCDEFVENFTTSRRVEGADWGLVLGVSATVEVDVSPRGKSSLAIRFRVGDARSQEMRVNEEICPLPGPPPAGVPSSTGTPSPSFTPVPTTGTPSSTITSPAITPPSIIPSPAITPSTITSSVGNNMPPQTSQAASEPSVCTPITMPNSVYTAAVNGAGSTFSPVFFDLETRSACNISEGGRRYAQHPTTEILSAVFLIDGRVVVWLPLMETPISPEGLWPEGYECRRSPLEVAVGRSLPAIIDEAVAAGRPLCAHNAFDFDRHVWRAKHLPEPSAWLDTLPAARAAGLPGKLDKLGELLTGRGKDEGAALLNHFCKPNRQGQFPPFTGLDVTRFARYNVADVLLLQDVYQVVGNGCEPDVVAAHVAVNDRGVFFDARLAQALISLDGRLAAEAVARMEQMTGGAVTGGDLRRDGFLRGWLRSQGVELEDLRRETVEATLESMRQADLSCAGNGASAVVSVLEARRVVSRITTSKLENGLAAADSDGRIKDLFSFHQAHTGRWAGRDLQPHNLPRPHHRLRDLAALINAADDPERFAALLPSGVNMEEAISSLIRPCIRASEDKLLAICDFASIEARGLAWCAGQLDLLEQFAQGVDVYSGLASQLYGFPVSKANAVERQVGKTAVLGCGYGLSARGFAVQAAKNHLDLVAAHITVEQVVEGYRDAYPAIAGTRTPSINGRVQRTGGLWRDVETAAFQAIRFGEPGRVGRCDLDYDGSSLIVRLPSCRSIYYRNARIEQRVPAYCHSQGLEERARPTIVFDGPDRPGTTTYGSKLVENVVQAICRDLLAGALVQCERRGLPVVLHVHDEIVVETESQRAGEALRELAVVMSTPPCWAEGFPIEVEGFVAERYFKSPPPGALAVKTRNGGIIE